MIKRFGAERVLMIPLIIGAFIIGSLLTKVQYLQQGNSVSAQAPATQPQTVAAVQPQVPTAPLQKQNVDIGHLPVKGNKDAKVTIIEFADLRCPFCQRFFTDTEPQIIKDYVDTGKAKLAFRHYAFLGAASVTAANAAECANEQNKFWQFHDYLYKNQPSESDTSMYTTDKLTAIAGQLGLNTSQFSSCLSSNKYQKIVDQDLADGQKAGVSGTPTTFVNGTPIVGAVPYAQIKAEIDKALQ